MENDMAGLNSDKLQNDPRIQQAKDLIAAALLVPLPAAA